MTEQDRRSVGAHEVWTEHGDLFCLRLVGELASSEVEQIIELARRWMGDENAHFWLIDASQLHHIGPEARRALATATPSPAFRGTVSFGVGFTQRLLTTMLQNVTKLVHGHATPTALFASEADARSYLEAVRREQAEAPKSATA